MREGGKYGKHRRRELGTRAAHRWPVASLHHPLPGLGSRAHLCQAERSDSLSVIVKETRRKQVRERYQKTPITLTDNAGQTPSTAENSGGLYIHINTA